MTHIPGHIYPLPIHDNYGFGTGNYSNWHNTPIWNWNRSTDLNTPPNREFAISELDAGRTPMNWDTSVSFSDLYQGIKEHPLSYFLPVANTAMHWDDMGALEKWLSVGMDAIDVATLGSGKLITAPIKAATKLATWGDPALTYVRAGNLPLEGQNFIPSYNYAVNVPEEGISTYQALKFPQADGSPQYILRPPPAEKVTQNIPVTSPQYGEPSMWTQEPQYRYTSLPVENQNMLLRNRPWYEVGGRPLGSLGADQEALLDPLTVYYKSLDDISNHEAVQAWKAENWTPEVSMAHGDAIRKLPYAGSPVQFPHSNIIVPKATVGNDAGNFRIGGVHDEFSANVYNLPYPHEVINPTTGKVIDIRTEIDKYNPQGLRNNRLLNLEHYIDPYLPPMTGTAPVTMPIRGVTQLPIWDQFRDTDPIPSDAAMQAAMLGGLDW